MSVKFENYLQIYVIMTEDLFFPAIIMATETEVAIFKGR